MQSSTPRVNQGLAGRGARLWRLFVRAGAAACVLAGLLAAAQQPPNRDPNQPVINPAANPVPDKNQQMQMQEQAPANDARYEAANGQRHEQIASEAAQLLELAKQLKQAVDKTDKDTLSVNVIRKAEMIEKLAKGVKQKMKQTAGAS